jgi:hypothetical protein
MSVIGGMSVTIGGNTVDPSLARFMALSDWAPPIATGRQAILISCKCRIHSSKELQARLAKAGPNQPLLRLLIFACGTK